jgi:hypothetical protein
MEASDKLFDQAKRLKPEQLSELVARIEEYLSLLGSKNGSKCSYARSLALAGTADSSWTDVSSHKAKHLAQVYAKRHDR